MTRPIAQRVVVPFPDGIKDYNDFKHYSIFCRASLIATGTHLDSRSFLAFSGQMILTADRFRIDEMIKAPSGIAAGGIVTIARPGGEVVDAGETLRVVVVGSGGPYIVQQHYLLIALQDPPLAEDQFTSAFSPVRVAGALMYVDGASDNDSVLGFTTEYRRFKDKIEGIAATVPCRKPS
jgi:hypothetical protein